MVEGKKYGLLNGTAQSVRSKLIITFLFMAIVPLCLLTWFSLQHVNSTLKKNADAELHELSSIASEFTNLWFDDHLTDLYTFKYQLANYPLEQSKLINHFVTHYDFVNSIEVIAASTFGQPIISPYGQIDKGELSQLINSVSTSAQATFGSVEFKGKQFNIVAIPWLSDAQKLGGVILAEVNMHGLLEGLSTIHSTHNDVSFFVLHNNKIERSSVTNAEEAPVLTQTTLTNKQMFEYSSTQGTTYNAHVSELDFLGVEGWQLLAAKPSHIMLKDFGYYKRLAILSNAVSLLLVLCAAWWFSRRLSKPLIQLTSVMTKITDGEKVTVPTLTDSHELNRLSVDLQKMVAVKEEQQSILQKQRSALQTAFKQLDEQKSALDEHAIVAVTDLAGTITFVNKKFCEISGYEEHELIGQNHRLLNSGRHDKGFFKSMYKTLKRGEVWNGQICNKAKHGGFYWVDTTIAPFFDEHGKPQSYIAIRTDVTPLKLQELELEQHKTQLQLVIDTTAVGIWDWFIDTSKVTFNNRWAEIIGYKLSELEPTTIDTWYKYAHPDDLVISEQKLKAHFNGDTDYYVSEARMKHKDGHWVWVLDTAKVVDWNLDGSPRRMIGTHLDITERKQIESELQYSRDRFASLVDNIPGVIYRCKFDKAWTMLYMSDQVKGITGYTPDAFINNKILSFASMIHKDDKEVELQVSTCIAQKLPWSIEYRIKRSDGHIRWVHEKGQAIYGDDNQVLYLDGFISDITERHNTQAEITRQQNLLEAMSKQGQIGAWEINLESQTMYWSDVVKVIHEVPEEFEPSIETAINFYKPGEHREKISTLFECAVTLGESWSVELIILTYTGKERWVKSMGQAEFKDGKCVRVFGSFQSIDTHKRLELESEKANAYNKNLASLTVSPEVQNSDVAQVKKLAIKSMVEVLNVERASIWILNKQCDEMACHGLYTRQNGFVDFDGVLKKADFPSYYEAIFDQNLVAIDDVYSHKATVEFTQSYTQPLNIESMLDAVISSGDGNLGILCAETVGEKHIWTQSEETYLRSLATLVGSTLVSQKRKETAEKLKVALVQAQEAAVAKSQFLATMSHEIRTPMNGVLGMLELVELESLSKPIEKKVAIAKSSAHSLLGVINDILDFSKAEAGKVELEHIHFNARDLIGEIAEAQAFTAQEKGIEIILDLVALEPSHLMGDPGRIRQVVTNLISNAVKFTSQGEVVVSASVEKTEQALLLNIKVKDSGIGITEAKQQQLFTPFSQVDASTTREYGGTGLGLAICKQLCELMNGKISLVSAPGKGSEFTATMQVAEGEEKERIIPNINMSSLNVLVVDDNETNRLVISQQLGHWGAKVTLASSAKQALELCAKRIENKQTMFDIAVLDMQMPEMDGMELCKVLKAHDDYKAMPLVMMTSIAGMEGAQRYSKIGFQAYFPKPVTTADLISALSVITSSDSTDPLPLVTPGYISSLRKEKSGTPAKILLVEDNPVNQHVSTLMLKKLNCEVILAQNGQEAINTLSEHNEGYFDLVLMDCQMPVMDGFDATANIRDGMAGDEHKAIKIIALTANAMNSDKERCINAGMDDYLTKPIQLDILKEKIEQYF